MKLGAYNMQPVYNDNHACKYLHNGSFYALIRKYFTYYVCDQQIA